MSNDTLKKELFFLVSLLIENDFINDYEFDSKLFNFKDTKELSILIKSYYLKYGSVSIINLDKDLTQDFLNTLLNYEEIILDENIHMFCELYYIDLVKEYKNRIYNKIKDSDFTKDLVTKIQKIDEVYSAGLNIKSNAELKKEYENFLNKTEDNFYYKSGYEKLDNMVKFFQGEITVIAGQTSTGKSVFSLNIFAKMSIWKNNYKGIYFDFEMNEIQLTNRIISAVSNIEYNKLATKNVERNNIDLLHKKKELLFSKDNFKLFSRQGLSFEKINSFCKKEKKNNGLDYIIIDLLDKVDFGNENKPNHLKIKEFMISLSQMAQKLKIHVFLVVQANRQSKHENVSAENLSGSSSIEQTASNVLIIQRKRTVQNNNDIFSQEEITEEDTRKATLKIDKNRNGRTGEVPLYFELEYARIKEN